MKDDLMSRARDLDTASARLNQLTPNHLRSGDDVSGGGGGGTSSGNMTSATHHHPLSERSEVAARVRDHSEARREMLHELINNDVLTDASHTMIEEVALHVAKLKEQLKKAKEEASLYAAAMRNHPDIDENGNIKTSAGKDKDKDNGDYDDDDNDGGVRSNENSSDNINVRNSVGDGDDVEKERLSTIAQYKVNSCPLIHI
jgi:hypothetical protein